MRDMWFPHSRFFGNDERSHSAGEREGRFTEESAASARDLQQPKRLKTELLAAGLLEGFRTLLNPELAKAIAEKAYEIFTAPEK